MHQLSRQHPVLREKIVSTLHSNLQRGVLRQKVRPGVNNMYHALRYYRKKTTIQEHYFIVYRISTKREKYITTTRHSVIKECKI